MLHPLGSTKIDDRQSSETNEEKKKRCSFVTLLQYDARQTKSRDSIELTNMNNMMYEACANRLVRYAGHQMFYIANDVGRLTARLPCQIENIPFIWVVNEKNAEITRVSCDAMHMLSSVIENGHQIETSPQVPAN